MKLPNNFHRKRTQQFYLPCSNSYNLAQNKVSLLNNTYMHRLAYHVPVLLVLGHFLGKFNLTPFLEKKNPPRFTITFI